MGLSTQLRLMLLCLTAPFWACSESTAVLSNANNPKVRIDTSVEVIPALLSHELMDIQPANNNLDVVWYRDRLFLAWRSAPNHFASSETRMHVASRPRTTDIWRHEGTFHLGTDLREPQLVVSPSGLLLYMAKLGTNPRTFEPQGSIWCRYISPQQWTQPVDVFPENFIPWRIENTPDGGFEVLGYTGGENVYEFDGDPIRIRWLVSDDGLDWHAHPQADRDGVVLEGGGSETALVHLDDGGIVAVVRNEAGDDDGFGSKICTASVNALGAWTCRSDPRKFDSPLLIRSAGLVWLIARRNLTDTGAFDLGRTELSRQNQALLYQAEYWNAPKRCAIWQIDPALRSATWITDLPSGGDTCFPSAVRAPDGLKWWIFDYRNELANKDLRWNQGQRAPTLIYRHEVLLSRQ